jgi:hypothetical protein
MASFDPEKIKMMQSIYREVIQRLGESGLLLGGQLRDDVAQDILRMVSCECLERDEIIALAMDHVDLSQLRTDQPSMDGPQIKPVRN